MTDKEEVDLIVKSAKLGKESAFKKLLNTYWSDIYRFQFAKTNDEEEAEDITIKTFAKAFDKIDQFDEQYNFKTWLISISKNLFIDSIRSQKKELESLNHKNSEAYNITDEGPTPEDKIIIEQNLAELLSYIKMLKPAHQKVIQLRYFQEMSYKDIAAYLNESMSSVKVKLLRSKKLLAEIIQNKND